MRIYPSKKHGLNPSMERCFFCGESTGVIALPGKLPGDAEAPRYHTNPNAACDRCEKTMEVAVFLVETVREPPADNVSRITTDVPELTGQIWALKFDVIRNIIQSPELAETIIEKGRCYIPRAAAEKLGLHEMGEHDNRPE